VTHEVGQFFCFYRSRKTPEKKTMLLVEGKSGHPKVTTLISLPCFDKLYF